MNAPIHVVFLPAWYHEPGIPYTGNFIRVQAIAVSRLTNCSVGLIYNEQARVFEGKQWSLSEVDGIRELRMRAPRIPKWGPGLSMWESRYVSIMEHYVKRFGKPDVVHAHSYTAGLAAAAIHRSLGIPYVLTEHASSIAQHQVGRLHARFARQAYRHAARLIAVSPFLAEKMAHYTESEIQVVPNCYDDRLFTGVGDQTDHQSFSWICVASMTRVKGIGRLLEAFSMYAKTHSEHLMIVGTGPLMKDMQRLAMVLGVGTAVRFIGSRNQREIARLLQASDAFICPSDVETFGVAVIEALACGLPVVTTPCGGPQAVINDANGIIAKDHSAAVLADSMHSLRHQITRYDRPGIATSARAQYATDRVARRLDTIYREASAS